MTQLQVEFELWANGHIDDTTIVVLDFSFKTFTIFVDHGEVKIQKVSESEPTSTNYIPSLPSRDLGHGGYNNKKYNM